MPDISFVIFDMDDVLYDYEHPVRLRLLEELTGRPAAEIHAAVWGGPHEAAAEAGDPATAAAYLAQFADLLGHPIDAATWCDIRRQMMRPRPQVLEMVRALKVRAEIALLTNNGMMLREALPVCAPEAVAIFAERAHVSAEFGLRKPDPAIYRRLCERYGHAPEKSAFVDDREDNVQGAREAGLSAHLYRSPADLHAFLAGHGLL